MAVDLFGPPHCILDYLCCCLYIMLMFLSRLFCCILICFLVVVSGVMLLLKLFFLLPRMIVLMLCLKELWLCFVVLVFVHADSAILMKSSESGNVE